MDEYAETYFDYYDDCYDDYYRLQADEIADEYEHERYDGGDEYE